MEATPVGQAAGVDWATCRGVVLAAVGGYLDTLGFIMLGGLFVNHVTGNIVVAAAEHRLTSLPEIVVFPVCFLTVIPATLGRQFDIALGTATDLIRAGGAGLDVVQIAGNTNSTRANPFVQIIVPASSGITDVAQLKDKTIGTPTLSGVIHAAVQYWAKQKGVEPASIKGVEPLATNLWMAQGSWARSNRAAIGRFVQSLAEAQTYIEQNNAEARRVLSAYSGMPAPVANSVALPTYNFDIRTQDLATWVKVLKDIGQFGGNVDPNKLVLAPAGKS